MTYHIAVCDDSAADREFLTDLTRRWAEARGHRLELRGFVSAEEFLFQCGDGGGFDMVLLDIEMVSMNGVALAKEIRKDNESVQIIFITGYSDYIAEGYEVAALHYLMKPVKEEKLFQILDRAVMKLQKMSGY